MGSERYEYCVVGVRIWWAHGSLENSMSHSYLYSPERPLRAWQTAQGAVEQGKGRTIGPQGGNNKVPQIIFVEERAKG